MILTASQIEEAAERLVDASLGKGFWDATPEGERQGYRMIVTSLAASLDIPNTPGAVTVFMAWMGDKLPNIGVLNITDA